MNNGRPESFPMTQFSNEDLSVHNMHKDSFFWDTLTLLVICQMPMHVLKFLICTIEGVFIRIRFKTFQNVFYSGLFQKPFTSSFYLDFFVYLELAFFLI